jgi:hypothetical protein
LINRHALDLMLSQHLFYAPWRNIKGIIAAERMKWFRKGPNW